MAEQELEAIFELGEEQEFDCEFRIDATVFSYPVLDDLPQVNGETIIGNKSSSDLHLASEQGLIDEIQNRQDADIEFANNLSELDSKVDGINANLTQQIEETQQDVNDKYNELVRDIDDLTDVVEEDYNTLNTRITNVADELQQSIEENVVALQQEDTALQNQINAHSTTLTSYDTRITNNANAIAQEIIDRQNADDALSDRIDAVESRGRFLALWNATTGLPESTPQITPYTYKTGDYYIVDQIGEVNYRPTGTEFVEGQPSTEIETEELTTDDVYYYDGAVWRLQVNHGKTVSFGNLAGQPGDNTNLKNALDGKVSFTNYATTQKAGVLKSYPNYAFVVDSSGLTYCDTKTLNYYKTISNSCFISKGTLENIKENLVTSIGDDKYQPVGDYATNTALTQGLATKQNTLVSGTNIKTLNNQSLLGSGNIEIKATPDLDNLTVSLNNENKVQSVGSILQSGGYQKYWQGTKAEYEAITNKDDNTLYEVLDDIVDVVTEIPTATVNDIGLVKPDNTTITVDDTGTISVKNSFANMNLSNVSNAYDWAIYSVTYGGGESGYTKYRNKRLEQWGVTNASANGESEITMHLPFKDMNYSVFIEIRETGDFFHYAIPSGVQKFKTRVKGANGNFYGAKFQWRAYGYYE